MTATWWIRPGGVTPTSSNGDQLAVDAPRRPQAIGDLTPRGVGLHRLDERGHEVVRAPRRVLEPGHRRRPGRRIAVSSHALETFDLPPLPFRVDPLEWRARGGRGVPAAGRAPPHPGARLPPPPGPGGRVLGGPPPGP